MQRVGVVLLGYGRMGRAAHVALGQVSADLEQAGIVPQLLGVFEADESLLGSLPVLMEGKTVLVGSGLSAAVPVSRMLQQELGLRPEDEFLVYDATSSHSHQQNLIDICQTFPRALYLGEKPIFTRRTQLAALELFGPSVLCDFVESQNEATLKLLELQREGLRIDRLRFWRLNSIGLVKLFDRQKRVGVTGGALLDKGVHDLALASVLLRNDSEGNASATVEEATNFAMLPRPASTGNGARVSTNGTSLGEAAAGYAKLRWGGSCDVDSEFRYSWVGVERFDEMCVEAGQPSLRDLLERFGLEEDAWLARSPLGPGILNRFEQQEARILLLDGAQRGRPVQLVVNFLRRPGIQPFILDVGTDSFVELGEHRYSANSLARIFDAAIRGYVSQQPLSCSPLGARVIHQVHSATFDIQDFAAASKPLFPATESVNPHLHYVEN